MEEEEVITIKINEAITAKRHTSPLISFHIQLTVREVQSSQLKDTTGRYVKF